MDLKDFIAIKGKSELFRILSKTGKGIIVETLNEARTKFKVQPNLQVLILNDITIFSKESNDLFLKDVFLKIFDREKLDISIGQKDSPEELKKYFTEIVPEHDEEKVYVSDIKKIIKWYSILTQWYPEVIEGLLREKEEEEKKSEEEAPEAPPAAEVSKTDEEGKAGGETKEAGAKPNKTPARSGGAAKVKPKKEGPKKE